MSGSGRDNAPVVVLAMAGSVYFAFLVLRFVPGAWEIANRASDFLFVGSLSSSPWLLGFIGFRYGAAG
jgi:hypothetical protein